MNHGLSGYRGGCRCTACRKRSREVSRASSQRFRENNPERAREITRLSKNKNHETVLEGGRRWIKGNVNQCIALLGGKCEWCNAVTNLEFDHIIAVKITGEKRGKAVYNFKPGKQRDAKLKKLQLLCVPCHKEKTSLDNGWMRWAVMIAYRQLTDKETPWMTGANNPITKDLSTTIPLRPMRKSWTNKTDTQIALSI